MKQKTKPIYLFIAGVLLLIVVLIFAFLLIQAYSSNSINNIATVDESQPVEKQTAENNYTISETKTSTQENDYVIKANGLCADKSGNVYDSNGTEYSVLNNYVAIVYEGEVYKIDVDYIQKTNPVKEKEKDPTEATKPTEKRNEETPPTNRNNNTEEAENGVSAGVSISQSQNVTIHGAGSQTAASNVKLNYKALSVKADALFNLVLTGADSSVVWRTEGEIIKIYQANGNQCTFTAIEKGTTQAVAIYKGESYYCTITII